MPDNITQKEVQALNGQQMEAPVNPVESPKDDMKGGQAGIVPDLFGALIWISPGSSQVSIGVQTGHSLVLTADVTPSGCTYTTSETHGNQHLQPGHSWKWGPNQGAEITITVKNAGPGKLRATV